MSDPEKPAEMTPEARMIIGRARMSFLFTIGLLILGFIVVAGALVYRSSQSGGVTHTNEYGLAAVNIPADAQVVSASASGGLVTVTFSQGGATRVRIFDGKTGGLIREFPIEAK